ncbi:hypothetical protein G6F52_007371 [Rhizopus delemar]|nr:hypothetical protein G6F52_007371 [Rhizopus delemar]
MQNLEKENELLRKRVAELEAKLKERTPEALLSDQQASSFEKVDKLTNQEIFRFGRQLVTPKFGYEAQLKLRNKSFLIVGAGGLGAPAALYLGAGGVGRLGIVDHDVVDINNLHRQVIHTEARRGVNKAVSAATTVKSYDIIIDATDNIATRYLLSDAGVLAGKPVVSGSALRTDGQLTIYNYNNGPCFRCLHPTPPPAAAVGRCVDNGVLGVVPGIIGILQALEAIKVAIGSAALSDPSFLIFSAMSNPMFRTMRLRQKKKDCAVCGENPTITELIDYVQFCQGQANDDIVDEVILKREERIDVDEYNEIIEKGKPHLLVDVRPKIQYDICHLPNSLHIPIEELPKEMHKVKEAMKEQNVTDKDVFVVCRLGNDSQIAVHGQLK